ncbi:MAG: hypothetical protein MUF45_12645 [Spirosomaceae bacterium]|jgi:hypothetical protein|nr:hypothetical protein [Spirosomataceae bacterium]
MKTLLSLTIILFATLGAFAQSSKRNKLIVLEKANLDDTTKVENKGLDNEMKEDMNRFLGFGMHVSLKEREEETSQNVANSKKKKSGVTLQMGFQLPKFIKTDPPNKVYKLGWNLGINI